VKNKEVGKTKGGLSRIGNRIGLFENGVFWKIVVLRWDKETESCGTVKRNSYILFFITRHDEKTGQMTLSEHVAHMGEKIRNT